MSENLHKKLIALDLDGTVVDYDGNISPELKQKLQELNANPDIHLVIATGRGVNGTLDVMHLAEIDPEYLICANGALTLRRDKSAKSGYVQDHVVTFDTTEVLTLVRPHLESAKYIVETGMGETLHTGLEIDSSVHAVHHEVSFADLLHRQASRIVVYSPDHALDDFLDIVAEIGLAHINYTVGHTAWLDIAPQGIGKESALSRLNDIFQIAGEHIFVAGDGDNDRGMLAWARDLGGHAVVMGQAKEPIQECATFITKPVTENGLLHSLTIIGL